MPYTPILATLGFRTTLAGASFISGVLIAVMATFSSAWPTVALMSVLFGSGFFRSLFFTSVNPLTFAETTDAEAAQATALASVFQQVSVACGVALAGGVLEASTLVTGTLGAEAFRLAFLATGAIAGASALFYVRMDPAVSANLSAKPQASARS